MSPDIMSPDIAGPVDGPDASVPLPRPSELDTADAALLDTLLREAPVGFTLLGPDFRFRRINQTLARMHDHDPDEHIGRSPAEMWPADFAARAESAVRRVLADGQPVFESEPAAGRALSWFPCHDQQGKVSGVVLIVADVAGHSHSEETIRRSEERYRSLVQGGAQMVWVADADGGLIEDCPEWRWVTGQTPEQYLGRGWLDAVHPEDRDRA
ncbi:MAG TPA: PAS domain-containing protein, partial [Streptosporangiaceae bacterium]